MALLIISIRFWKGDGELEVRTATYGPGIDQSKHAKIKYVASGCFDKAEIVNCLVNTRTTGNNWIFLNYTNEDFLFDSIFKMRLCKFASLVPFLSKYFDLTCLLQVIVIPSRNACAEQSRRKSDLDWPTPQIKKKGFKILSKFRENFLRPWKSKR